MSVTEIYSCRPGQKLKEGRLDYSHDITSRAQAEADAKRRCMGDSTLAKIAYYTVGDDGSYRLMYTHTIEPKGSKPAPRIVAAPKKGEMMARSAVAPRPAPPPPAKPQGLFGKLFSSLKK